MRSGTHIEMKEMLMEQANGNEGQDTEQNETGFPETVPSDETVRTDEADAAAAHRADRMPTAEEERVAEEVSADVPSTVAEEYEHMAELGANTKGEGRPGA